MPRPDVAASTRNQFTRVVGLTEIIVSTQTQSTRHIGWLARGCRYDNNWDTCRTWIVAQHLHSLEAVNVGHLNVHEDKIGMKLLSLFYRDLPIIGLLHTEI